MQKQPKYEVKCRLIKGDEVEVVIGKSRGERGKIERIDRKKGKIYITGVNTYKRHTKPSMGSEGGIIDKVMPVDFSNVMIVDPKSNKPSRIGYKIEDGKKVRYAKKSGTIL